MALSIGGALMLGACSPAEPAPPPTLSTVAPSEATTPTPTSSPSPTHEPTESQPPELPGYPESLLVEPEAMSKDDEAGAVAAAKYYLGLFAYANLTGELEKWEEMALPGCEFCEVAAEGVRQVHAAGGWTESGQMAWTGVPDVIFEPAVNVWEITLLADVGEGRGFDSNGQVMKTYEASSVEFRIGVTYMHGRWRVQGIRASGASET